MVKYLSLIFLLVVLGSCFNKGDCLKTNTDKVWIAFKRKSDGKADTITINSVKAQGFQTILLKDSTIKGNAFSLQVNPTKTQTNFIFNYIKNKNVKSDTLKLTYRQVARILASDCGAFLYLNDLDYIKSGFDSVRIVNPELLSTGFINVQIYL